MVAEISEFKGTPVISLKEKPEDPYGFTFGKRKAKLIIDHLEDIKRFVEE